MNQYDLMFDLNVIAGHCDLYFVVHDFTLHLGDNLMYDHHTLGFWVSMTHHFTSKLM